MSKITRRSDFSQNFAFAQQPQPQPEDQEDDLWDFDAPRYVDFAELQANPPVRAHILDFGLQPNCDDYWFTYAHYQHEEEPNVEPVKSQNGAPSITAKKVNTKGDDHHMPGESSRPRTERRLTQNQEKLSETQEPKKRLTVNSNLSKDHFGGQQRIPQSDQTTQPAQIQQGGNPYKRKFSTTSTSFNRIGMKQPPSQILKVDPSVQNNENEVQQKASVQKVAHTETFEPPLKRFKENRPPPLDDLEEAPIRIDVKSVKSSKTLVLPPVWTNKQAAPKETTQTTTTSNRLQGKQSLRKVVVVGPPKKYGNENVAGNESKTKEGAEKKGEVSQSVVQSTVVQKKEREASVKRMIYEPPKYSARDVRKWERMTGKSWYNLTCQERQIANIEMGKMIENQKQ